MHTETRTLSPHQGVVPIPPEGDHLEGSPKGSLQGRTVTVSSSAEDTNHVTSRYKIETLIKLCGSNVGSGSFGTVYKVDSTVKPIQTWLKTIGVSALEEGKLRILALKKARTDPSFLQSDMNEFCRELTALKTLKHTHIMPFVGSYQRNGVYILVMPFFPYCLGDVIKHPDGNPYGLREMFSVSHQLASAMEYLHMEMNWIHCDIKSNNVLLDDDGNAVLGDFGSSGMAEDIPGRDYKMPNGEGLFAPEFFLYKAQPNKQSDVFSFGRTLLQMLTCGQKNRCWAVRDDTIKSDWPSSDFEEICQYQRSLNEHPSKNAAMQLHGLMLQCLSLNPEGRPVASGVMSATTRSLRQYDNDVALPEEQDSLRRSSSSWNGSGSQNTGEFVIASAESSADTSPYPPPSPAMKRPQKRCIIS